tara:strand:+ start:1526 stop:1819 length:294 start_codon:yes stop_codon:yes gene_type:complete
MFYRVTKLTVKPGTMKNIVDYLNKIEDRFIEFNGMVSVNCVQVSDTEGFAFSSWNTMEEAENAAELQSELMGGMKEWLAGPPERMVGKVIWSWSPEK